jgi:hypothetical protein
VKWQKLDERPVWSGHYRRVVSKRFRTPDGAEHEFEVKDEDDSVAILALTEKRDVLLVRQFRVGVEENLSNCPAEPAMPATRRLRLLNANCSKRPDIAELSATSGAWSTAPTQQKSSMRSSRQAADWSLRRAWIPANSSRSSRCRLIVFVTTYGAADSLTSRWDISVWMCSVSSSRRGSADNFRGQYRGVGQRVGMSPDRQQRGEALSQTDVGHTGGRLLAVGHVARTFVQA